jgi:hypothetical protein
MKIETSDRISPELIEVRHHIMNVLGYADLQPEFCVEAVGYGEAELSAYWLFSHVKEAKPYVVTVREKRTCGAFTCIELPWSGFIDYLGDQICVHDINRSLSAYIRIKLVGIELNPGPVCKWGTGPSWKEDCRNVIKVDNTCYCPVCGGIVNRVKPNRPFFHEDVQDDMLDYLRTESAPVQKASRDVVKRPSTSCPKPVDVANELKETAHPNTANFEDCSADSALQERIAHLSDLPPAPTEAPIVENVVSGCPTKEEHLKNSGVQSELKDRGMSFIDFSEGDTIELCEMSVKDVLGGISVKAVKLNPRSRTTYQVANMICHKQQDSRLPGYRGVQLTDESYLVQQVAVHTRNGLFWPMLASVLSFLVGCSAAVCSYNNYESSLPVFNSSTSFDFITDFAIVLALPYNACRILVSALFWELMRASTGIWIIGPHIEYYMANLDWQLPASVVLFASLAAGFLVLSVVILLAYYATGIAHSFLSKERVYLHVPTITSAMIADNFGSTSEEVRANLITVFRRHVGTLNLPASMLCAVEEGCVYIAEKKIAEGLGFRLWAPQGAL